MQRRGFPAAHRNLRVDDVFRISHAEKASDGDRAPVDHRSWIGRASIAALVWVAAPALSLRPYMSGALDFERAIPASKRMAPRAVALVRAAHPREAAPRWISAPVEAPHRFDLVGVARELRPVQI